MKRLRNQMTKANGEGGARSRFDEPTGIMRYIKGKLRMLMKSVRPRDQYKICVEVDQKIKGLPCGWTVWNDKAAIRRGRKRHDGRAVGSVHTIASRMRANRARGHAS